MQVIGRFLLMILVFTPIGLFMANILQFFYDIPEIQHSSYWNYLALVNLVCIGLVSFTLIYADYLYRVTLESFGQMKAFINVLPEVDSSLHLLVYDSYTRLERMQTDSEGWFEMLLNLSGFGIIAIIGILKPVYVSTVIDFGNNGQYMFSLLMDVRSLNLVVLIMLLFGIFNSFGKLKEILKFRSNPTRIVSKNSRFNFEDANNAAKRIFGVELKDTVKHRIMERY